MGHTNSLPDGGKMEINSPDLLSRVGRNHECVIENTFHSTDILVFVHYILIYKICTQHWMGHPKISRNIQKFNPCYLGLRFLILFERVREYFIKIYEKST